MTNDLSQCGNCIYHYTYNGRDMCKQVGDDFYLQWKVEDCPYHTTITSATKISDEIYRLRAENAALRERLKKAVELPLECGSAVWYLNTHKSISLNENTVYEGILERYHLAPIGGKLYFIVDIRIKNDYGITVLPEVEKDYGKTWFTSREAAEARLAELKGDK